MQSGRSCQDSKDSEHIAVSGAGVKLAALIRSILIKNVLGIHRLQPNRRDGHTHGSTRAGNQQEPWNTNLDRRPKGESVDD